MDICRQLQPASSGRNEYPAGRSWMIAAYPKQMCTQVVPVMPSSARLSAMSPYSRAYSGRVYLKGRYRLADADLKKAIAINPNARQMATIRGMLNERTLQPSVILEEHQ